jgi:NAD(P)-dependent dehydrogenase (short-subunit alcohol dehydrogenase family)
VTWKTYGREMQSRELAGKAIVVTGAAGLLGLQHCRAILLAGGCPILVDVSTSRLEIAKASLALEFAIEVETFSVDICDEATVKDFVERLSNSMPAIDGLINNAASNPKMDSKDDMGSSRLEKFSLEQWNKDISVGLTGAFVLVKHLWPMLESAPSASVVNISSDLGVIAPDQRLYADFPGQQNQPNVKPVSYSVVKHGIIGLTKYLATYWTGGSIRVNTLCPGGVVNGQPEELIKRIEERIPAGRMAEPDEYVGAIQFLLSDASKYMNGQTLVIDGGRTVW